MMRDISIALAVPTALTDAANRIGAELGYGPENFTRPLGDGRSVTHMAAQIDVDPAFMALLAVARGLASPATLPPDQAAQLGAVLAARGDDLAAVMPALLVMDNRDPADPSLTPPSRDDLFDAALLEWGLVQM